MLCGTVAVENRSATIQRLYAIDLPSPLCYGEGEPRWLWGTACAAACHEEGAGYVLRGCRSERFKTLLPCPEFPPPQCRLLRPSSCAPAVRRVPGSERRCLLFLRQRRGGLPSFASSAKMPRLPACPHGTQAGAAHGHAPGIPPRMVMRPERCWHRHVLRLFQRVACRPLFFSLSVQTLLLPCGQRGRVRGRQVGRACVSGVHAGARAEHTFTSVVTCG